MFLQSPQFKLISASGFLMKQASRQESQSSHAEVSKYFIMEICTWQRRGTVSTPIRPTGIKGTTPNMIKKCGSTMDQIGKYDIIYAVSDQLKQM